MKSALSLTVAVCLAGSALTVTAQARTETDGPIARSMTRETARLAAALPNQSAEGEWSRVRNLAPGTELVLIVKGSQPSRWYFMQADDTDLDVQRIARVGSLVEKIARTDIVEIRTVRTRGSVSGAVIGTGAGLLLGVVTFAGIEFNHCLTVNGGCHGASGLFAGLALVGFPAAGGLWGYHHGHKTVAEEVIYRAP